MYVVLTSKPGEYRTEAGTGVEPVAAYEYHFHGRLKAIFTIARIQDASRVRIVEETEGGTINDIPTRQMEKFHTREEAYDELHGLTQFGTIEAELRECALTA
ncbi:ferredoxin [Alcaligenaceae bacterium 429]|uniref:ferredoxin n=1 Tax=Paenalcaligenes sp. Me52 TaxID=3392038 RepID=UPI0010922305|nr:ferredoxin [Alcaligenaceae bacterium 429]